MTGLYTQCPDCSTVFRVTADTLRAAQGRVQCGICSAGFNALENLSEQPVPRTAAERREEDTITVEEHPGNEFIELPGAAAEDDAAAAALPDGGPDGDSELDALTGAALEFHGSPADLDRLFVEAGSAALEATPARAGAADGTAELEPAIDAVATADFTGIEVSESELPGSAAGEDPYGSSNPGLIASALALPAAALTPADPVAEGDQETPRDGAEVGEQADDLDSTDEFSVLVMDDTGDEAAGTSPDGAQEPDAIPLLLIPEQLRRDAALSAAEELATAPDFAQPAGPHRWPLVAGAILLAVVLAAQAAHHWREALSRSPVLGPWLLRSYAALGVEAPAPVDLSAFELRQLGAASEPSQAGRIKVRASIVNGASFAQPYPVLRLSLQDRFGATIGARELVPEQYLPGGAATASGLLGPAQRADAEVVFVDPGRDAVGFELDVCVAQAAGLRCSADLPQKRR